MNEKLSLIVSGFLVISGIWSFFKFVRHPIEKAKQINEKYEELRKEFDKFTNSCGIKHGTVDKTFVSIQDILQKIQINQAENFAKIFTIFEERFKK